MFSLQTSQHSGLEQLHIRSDQGDAMDIALSRGARLNLLSFKGQSVIAGGDSAEDIKADIWAKSALLFPFPNRLAGGKYEFKGRQYQFPINEPERNNAIHGFLDQVGFELRAQELSENGAKITVGYQYSGDRDYYPFPCDIEVGYELTQSGRLIMTFSVKNTGQTAMPIGFGWHPYFTLGADSRRFILKLPELKRIARNQNLIPNGEQQRFGQFLNATALEDTLLDDGFLYEGDTSGNRVELSSEDGTTLSIQGTANLPYWQLFTPPIEGAVALEPMSCNINALQNGDGLCVLEPGEHFAAEVVISVS